MDKATIAICKANIELNRLLTADLSDDKLNFLVVEITKLINSVTGQKKRLPKAEDKVQDAVPDEENNIQSVEADSRNLCCEGCSRLIYSEDVNKYICTGQLTKTNNPSESIVRRNYLRKNVPDFCELKRV